jgi:CRP-like cAMP-binding protein
MARFTAGPKERSNRFDLWQLSELWYGRRLYGRASSLTIYRMPNYADGNAILRLLLPEELARLEPYLKLVPLAAGQRLSTSEEPVTRLWFPLQGALSRLVHLPTGETVEAGIVGNEGVVGLPVALGGSHWLGLAAVQVPGSALSMTAADYEEHVRRAGSPLHDALMLYVNLYITILAQLTACHCLHRIEQRLSRCILTLDDYSANGSVKITHDTLADFLGVHRPSVTYALQSLAESGAIASERRRILIHDREALVAHSCQCYRAIKEMTARELDHIKSVVSG